MSRNYRQKHYFGNTDTYGTSDDQIPMDPITRNGKVTNAPFVKLRDNPSFDGETKKLLSDGTGVEIFGKANELGFYEVEVEYGKETLRGYIHQDFLVEVGG